LFNFSIEQTQTLIKVSGSQLNLVRNFYAKTVLKSG